MAELIITDEERESLTYLEWSDEALGRACKQVATILGDTHGKHAIPATAAAVFLIDEMTNAGSEQMDIDLTEAYKGDKSLGNYTVTIKEKQS